MSTDKEFLDDNFIFSEEADSSEEIKEIKTEEPYQKHKKNKVKYEGKKDVVSVQKKKIDSGLPQTKLISVSSKNKQVFDILKNIKKNYSSESDFICQAIIEKYEREQTGKSSNLKANIKEILEEMAGENFIIMKSSSDVINVPTTQKTIEPSIKEAPMTDNNASLIRGALDMWDEN